MIRGFVLFIVVVSAWEGSLEGQSSAEPSTRTQSIEKERVAKLAQLKPEEVTKGESFLRDLKDQKWLERVSAGYNGFRLKIGNMVTGGGFALGPEYFREDLLDGALTTRVSAQVSTRAYEKYEAEARMPRLLGGLVALEFLGSRRNYASLNYYGPGPDSLETNRSNYRLEDTSFDGIAALQPVRFMKFGGSLGGLWVNVGPGNDERFVSAEKIFNEAQSPGLTRQTNFLRTSVFGQLDYRDNPLGPKAGGNYVIQYSWYQDRKLEQFGFRRLDLDLQQYVPFFNKTRRIALRAKGTFTENDRAQKTPFYLQPILGGSDDLRGFRYFRFSDRNSMVLNAEYQWEIFSGLEGAVFGDAGKVMPRRSQLNFSDLESSVGVGLRFNVRNATFLRFDAAFSHEGFQLWFKFNDAFNQRRFGTTTGQPVY